MKPELKKALTKAMEQLLAGDIPDTDNGICSNLKYILRHKGISAARRIDAIYLFTNTLTPTWPEYSGTDTYPIPSTDPSISAYSCYHLRNHWQGKQLEYRQSLLKHCLLYLKPTCFQHFAMYYYDLFPELAKPYIDILVKGPLKRFQGICANATLYAARAGLYCPHLHYYKLTMEYMDTWKYSAQVLPNISCTKWEGIELKYRKHLLKHIIKSICLDDPNTPVCILQYMKTYRIRNVIE